MQQIALQENHCWYTARTCLLASLLISIHGTIALAWQPPRLIKDVNPGSASSSPTKLIVAGGRLFFLANDGTHGNELWITDGTEAGTTIAGDICAGNTSSSVQDPYAFGDKLVFSADDGVHGREPWLSDGTAAGTVLLKDIRTVGDSSSAPTRFIHAGSSLYFCAEDNSHGRELWKSDATDAGTAMVKAVTGGVGFSTISHIGDYVYFGLNSLWKTDGTAAGTIKVWSLYNSPVISPVMNCNGTLLFVVNSQNYGRELYTTDGTSEGTSRFMDINPGAADAWIYDLTPVANTLFFRADDGTHGKELWKTDGTVAGTVLVKDIRSGSSGANIFDLTAVGSILFFTADDGVHGIELWKSDGTTDGTVMVKDINPGSFHSHQSGFTSDLVDGNGTLFFRAIDGSGSAALWRSDGTAAGTVMVPGTLGIAPQHMTFCGGNVFFSAVDATLGTELFVMSAAANVPPTDLSISSTAIYENSDPGTVVGTLNAHDPDTDDSVSFSLVSGTGDSDNGCFAIVGNVVVTTTPVSYETRKSLSICVRATDQGGLTCDRQFSITVLDVFEPAPVITSMGLLSPGKAVLQWSSIPYHQYSIHQSTNLSEGFVKLHDGIVATPPSNTHTTSVPVSGSVFWQLATEE